MALAAVTMSVRTGLRINVGIAMLITDLTGAGARRNEGSFDPVASLTGAGAPINVGVPTATSAVRVVV